MVLYACVCIRMADILPVLHQIRFPLCKKCTTAFRIATAIHQCAKTKCLRNLPFLVIISGNLATMSSVLQSEARNGMQALHSRA